MIDLHTHILCGMDDGAKTPAESLQMLRMERDSGVTTVVLTPHFYREKARPEHFFRQREKALETLTAYLEKLDDAEAKTLPRLIPGAEVAWWPNMDQEESLEAFCFPGTRNMLLELPFTPWDRTLCNQLYSMMNRTGITPVLAHMERYLPMQDPSLIAEILSLGCPGQITAAEFTHFGSRRKALRALDSWAYVIATDCHNAEGRKPDLGQAMAVVEKKLGHAAVQAIDAMAESLLK